MRFIHYTKGLKSPELQAIIIEPILIRCIKGVSRYELLFEMRGVLPLPYTILKMYLLYMIDYDLISYHGQDGVYFIERGGLDLLSMIEEKRKISMENIGDITITFE